MAAPTNVHGFNVGGNNNSFDQRGHFYRAFLDGNVSGMLVKQNSTPNMTVLVEHGSALLNKNTTSASVVEIKSNTSVTIDTANTSNPRIDTVVIYEDTSVAIPTVESNYWQDGAGGRFKIVSLSGTAAASPVALTDAAVQSAIGAGKPWARLASITVLANSTTIVNSNINNSVRNQLSAAIADGAVGPTKRSGGFYVNIVTLSPGSGTKTISGFGFKPKMVEFIPAITSTTAAFFSHGIAIDGSPISQVFSASTSGSSSRRTINGNTAALVVTDQSVGSNLFVASVSSFNADGVTIDVTTDNASFRDWIVKAVA